MSNGTKATIGFYIMSCLFLLSMGLDPAVTNILLYVIPTIIGIYFGVKVIKHE